MNSKKLKLLSILWMSLIILMTNCGGDPDKKNINQSTHKNETIKTSVTEKIQLKPDEEVKGEKKKEINSDEKLKKSGKENDIFKGADINADGKISKNEFHKMLRARYRSVDKNKDGKITTDECKYPGYIKDKNKKYLLYKDYIAIFEKGFSQADIDKDGYITDKERKIFFERDK